VPRALPNPARRSIEMDTGKRTIDLPVDGAGHVRRLARLSEHAVTRAEGDDAPIGFRGHASVASNRTWIGSKRYGFWEEIAPGAFAKTLNEADVRFLINHDPNLVLARNTAGTLRLSEDDVGLAVDADLAPTSYGKDLAISLDRGDVTQMSFAFDMIGYEWRIEDDGTEVLRHTEVALWDVSAVTYPAYADTDAGLRSDLMAVARAAGFDAIDFDGLCARLAEPDDDLLAALRCLARSEALPLPRPAVTTEETNEPDGARSDCPPAETTGDPSPIRDLAIRTLQMATTSRKG
jgi:uncharacterized protein